ncbi:hypothetical protein Phi4:1_gp022 [Cellulophaga phage phi4:1]|uniref:Uncharacterized protein n=3 Tax=Lightbulbvirus Cba41 TaxID=1918524 RepID=A0A0S2MWB5_9CAUD|nr:hypothetical protein Phi4:1_gp022 [Cellulophaga phage phi4:1]AGO49435.1 hypothetical protein Phi4:1_gp022 [Cellulophaga phage phi4:1]ALO80031.1 hypothetical protein Phi4113_022 [Cellulophaga phage phi4:1_13]ALO80228.1 hypothetical protein Phi4118_022 [Cellulophaga phage phi4:1_18]
MKKRRNCCVVISEMITNIPTTEIALIKDLEWNLDDASYKAPEDTLQWTRTQSTLIKHIPKPVKDWHFKVVSIFTTLSIEDIKKHIEE